MLILLPSDVQGRGNALIISSRVPLKEKPSGGGWRAAGWGVQTPPGWAVLGDVGGVGTVQHPDRTVMVQDVCA